MKSLRPMLSGALLLGILACNESPTLAGNNPAVGRDGALVVSRTEVLVGIPSQPPRLTVIDPATGATRGLATWLPYGYPGESPDLKSSLVFSRDGEWMAWVETHYNPQTCNFYDSGCFSERGSQRLFVSRVGSNSSTVLTPDGNYDVTPSFSPDGTRIVFLRSYFDLDQQMMTIRRDGTDLQPVLQKTPRKRGAPDWAPDGRTIFYLLPDQAAIYRVRPDGNENAPVTGKNTAYGNPSVSPDGKLIAVTVRDASTAFGVALALFDPDGNAVGRFDYGEGSFGARPVWSPDGTQIAYCAYERDAEGRYPRDVVRLLDVSTGNSRTITPTGYSDCNPVWRP
ncbi:MAG: hypothetical protein V4503_02690 [Gemmatimonadota bacterium]